jgi:hypothetical protein
MSPWLQNLFNDQLELSSFKFNLNEGVGFMKLQGALSKNKANHQDGSPVVRVWDQEVCSLCGLRFKPCGCSYDGHWRLTWSLTSGPVGLVEVRAS